VNGTPDKQHLPAGSTAEGEFVLAVTPEHAGWAFSGLRVLELSPGGSHRFGTREDELIVLPLAGSCTVRCDGRTYELEGRESVPRPPYTGKEDVYAALQG
jgi:5-deoxy-D-glucuronate isomerase